MKNGSNTSRLFKHKHWLLDSLSSQQQVFFFSREQMKQVESHKDLRPLYKLRGACSGFETETNE